MVFFSWIPFFLPSESASLNLLQVASLLAVTVMIQIFKFVSFLQFFQNCVLQTKILNTSVFLSRINMSFCYSLSLDDLLPNAHQAVLVTGMSVCASLKEEDMLLTISHLAILVTQIGTALFYDINSVCFLALPWFRSVGLYVCICVYIHLICLCILC